MVVTWEDGTSSLISLDRRRTTVVVDSTVEGATALAEEEIISVAVAEEEEMVSVAVAEEEETTAVEGLVSLLKVVNMNLFI